MRILVPVREVPDPALPLRLRPDGSGPDMTGIAGVINPFDAIALEEAVQLREKGWAQEVIVFTVGPAHWEGSLRTALAMGGDRGIRLDAPTGLDPLPIARAIAALVHREDCRLVLMGRQGVDCDYAATGPMVAAMLGWGQATFASGIDMQDDTIRVTREVDGGLAFLTLALPALITVDLRLNTPRYASLPNIMKARHKPVETMIPQELNIDMQPGLEILSIRQPQQRPQGRKLANTAELANILSQSGLIE